MIITEDKFIYLNTRNTSYIIRMLPDGTLYHCYYGKKIPSENMEWHNLFIPHTITASLRCDNDVTTKDGLPQEYPSFGRGDYSEPAVVISGKNGRTVNDLCFIEAIQYNGVSHLEGLPHLDTCKGRVDTLEITLHDKITGADIILFYTVFEECDIIARHTVIKNNTNQPIKIHKAASASLDFEEINFDALTLNGAWIRERMPERYPLHHGKSEITSRRGASGHHSNPFMALLDKKADEHLGDVYGMALVYSGDFKIGAQISQFNTTRFYAGLNDETFNWTLDKGETFTTPQVMLTYSENGLNGMSGNFHMACRNHLGVCTSRKKHPILLNLWEAFYFNINEERVLNAISQASELGIDTIVIDDGWFGNRNDDKTSLGDWVINEEKFPNGFNEIIKKCKQNNLNLGIWFEPESGSRESNLYRQHPDWFISIDGIESIESRNQLLLDYSIPEVSEYIFNSIYKILKKYEISYFKWDFNRNITDNGSVQLEPERQGEHSHRYMLGVYSLMSRLKESFPNVFFEGSSGGGGRFDFGILYYMPQIWASDNSDACERMKIQYSTSIVYPPETISAHISVCPNHQTGRTTPFETRENVAQLFSFAYELDLNDISLESKNIIKEQIRKHRNLEPWLCEATFYRLQSPFSSNTCVWQMVSADKKDSAIVYSTALIEPNFSGHYIKPKGLEPNIVYEINELNIITTGDVLMNAGIPIKAQSKDFESKFLTIKQKSF